MTATTDSSAGRPSQGGRRRGQGRGRGEQPMVPEAEFRSYYGRPVLKAPVWKTPDVPAYLMLGGLAAGSSLLAAGAQATGRARLAGSTKLAAVAGAALSGVALVHDLGRPERFLNMLRVFKPSSPLSMGAWMLATYGPATGVAAASAVTGRAPRTGAAATAAAAALAPGIATYTAVLLSDTAVPAWHEAHRELPFTFVGSAAGAAGGLALLTTPVDEAAPARRLATLGVATELAAARRMEHRMGMLAEPYREGRPGRLIKAGEALAAAGVIVAHLGRRSRAASAAAGAALVAASTLYRFGVFEAGIASAADPRYTVGPQRERLAARTDQTAS